MNSLQTIRTANRVLGAIAPRFTASIARKMLMTPTAFRPRAEETDVLRRAEPVTFRFGLAGLRWGQPDAPIVLMLHGWQGRATQFHAFIDPLLAGGRQVISLDAPAHGRSPGVESNVFAFIEALLEASSDLRGVETVIGHSMGGAASLTALVQRHFAERAVTIGSPAALARVLDRFANVLALPAPAKQAFFEIVDRHVGTPARELDMAHLGSALHIPGLVVHDRDDDSVPYSEAEALIRGWSGARLMETRGLGHHRILRDPAVVEAVTAFALGRPLPARLAA